MGIAYKSFDSSAHEFEEMMKGLHLKRLFSLLAH